MSEKRVLILGANGFVGTHLTHYLSELGYEITVLVRDNSFTLQDNHSIKIIYGNVLHESTLVDALKDIDIVYNIAGVGLNRIKHPKGNDITFNQDSAKCLVDAILKTKRDIRIVYLSTIKVTGPAINANDAILENKPYESFDAYGSSKAQAEKIYLEYASKYNIKTLIIRAPFITGEGDKNCRILFNMKNWPVKLHLLCTAMPQASYVDVKDLCKAMEQLSLSDMDTNIEIVNVAHNQTADFNILIDEVFKYNTRKYITVSIPAAAVYACVRFMEFLHIKPFLEPERVKDLSEYRWVCSTDKLFDKYHIICETDINSIINRVIS